MWSTASCKYIFFQFNLMDSCFNSLIRLSKYRLSQFISGDGMSFSGSLEIMVKNKSSVLLWKFWKKSFNRFGFLSSISIVITPFTNSISDTEIFYKRYEIGKKCCSRNHLISFTINFLRKFS